MKPETREEDYSELSREELESECRAQKARAERAEAFMDTFLVAMTHELKTPLNAILGFAEALVLRLSGPLNDTQARQLASIDKSAKRLMALVNDVLDISKARAGRLSFAMEEFDAGLAIRKVMAALAPEGEARGIELRAELGGDRELHAIGDVRRFEQVVQNVVSNALKFTEKGRVSIKAGAEGGAFRLAVADTGIGISEEDMAELFKPFSQLDSGRARHYEGAGLGLALSKLIIEAMGGNIEVSSRPGEGSVFTISLAAPA